MVSRVGLHAVQHSAHERCTHLFEQLISPVELSLGGTPCRPDQESCVYPTGEHGCVGDRENGRRVDENDVTFVLKCGEEFYSATSAEQLGRIGRRGAGGEQVTLFLDGEQLGTMEWGRALQTAHEGAVYLHRGGSYLVERFDPKTAVAELVAKQVDYYTQPILQSVIETKTEFAKRPLGHAAATSCGISVTDLVLGYRTRSLDSGGVRAVFDLDLPSTTYDTVGIRLAWSSLDGSKPLLESQVAGLHGFEHALMAVAPIIAGCDRGDLGSAWYVAFADPLQDQARLHPTIFVFDRTPGGVGLCEKLFESLTGWLSAALQLLTSCECENGCPACLFSSLCEVNNDMLAKPDTIRLLQGLR